MRFVKINWSRRDVKPIEEMEFKDIVPALPSGLLPPDISILRWGEKLEYLRDIDGNGNFTWAEVK